MTAKFGTVLDHETWEARIVDPFSPMVSTCHEWRNSRTTNNTPPEREFVVWDKAKGKRVTLPVSARWRS